MMLFSLLLCLNGGEIMTVEIKDLKGLLVIKTSVKDSKECLCLLKTITAKYYETLEEDHVVVYF